MRYASGTVELFCPPANKMGLDHIDFTVHRRYLALSCSAHRLTKLKPISQ